MMEYSVRMGEMRGSNSTAGEAAPGFVPAGNNTLLSRLPQTCGGQR